MTFFNISRSGPPGRRTNRPTWQVPDVPVRPAVGLQSFSVVACGMQLQDADHENLEQAVRSERTIVQHWTGSGETNSIWRQATHLSFLVAAFTYCFQAV